MDQSIAMNADADMMRSWTGAETDTVEHDIFTLREEQLELEYERRELELEKEDFARQKDVERQREEKEKYLFDMKWKILERELRNLADERAKFEKQREFYRRVGSFEDGGVPAQSGNSTAAGALFFAGVADRLSVKKRYRALLKIYHPDNTNGDTVTLQEISREYDRLMQMYAV